MNKFLVCLACTCIFLNFFLLAKLVHDNNNREYIIVIPVYKESKNIDYFTYKKNFKWLNKKLYLKINEEGKKQNVDLAFIVSIIDAESYGRNIIGRRNRNGTRDYGIMQVNGVHEPKNPRKLLNISYNLQKGVGYIKYCTNKSVKRYGKAEIKTIARLYNQGANGSEKRYKNWKYVEKVYNNYKRVKEI